ncbi:hypothetical protein HanXRQr2_Chr16g0748681 [Helianthus annuus]|uniref:Uncharacterized protein n=1 Tax=Helianthus annuus TaxID=4232 RepID=A0A9K3DTK7_HELAN|nr:hypothetical protein HanXRQr2_Chr16g0748681 [Helianthus annuus]KAJ0438159.1 hypothetical protein HanHA300_Chr16g0610731 [Helianthus annuus]KAJ0442829.1 hypothetical protein HanIR_Chr16g0813811 [Helianthus annuus]KAJ0460479.1 hypothetical protein HanHA89_Chr16g0661291 [Helianthus annuus]
MRISSNHRLSKPKLVTKHAYPTLAFPATRDRSRGSCRDTRAGPNWGINVGARGLNSLLVST